MNSTSDNLSPEQAAFRQGLVCAAFGVSVLALCVWLLGESVENLRSGSWPRTAGTVDSIQVMKEMKTRSGPQYIVEVRYTFTVGGTVYHGDRFNTRGNYLAGEEGAAAVALSYHAGGRCTVAYDPNNPNRCFLDTSLTWHTWGKSVLGGIAGILGLILLFFGLKGIIWVRRSGANGIG